MKLAGPVTLLVGSERDGLPAEEARNRLLGRTCLQRPRRSHFQCVGDRFRAATIQGQFPVTQRCQQIDFRAGEIDAALFDLIARLEASVQLL